MHMWFRHAMPGLALLLGSLSVAAQTPGRNAPAPVRFVFLQNDPNGAPRFVVFELTDAARIQEARAILATPNTLKHHVQGTIVKKPAAYNVAWSFHLDPSSIAFFEMQAEVCDANVTWVQEHLAEIGGSALPNSFWCPWSSRIVLELP